MKQFFLATFLFLLVVPDVQAQQKADSLWNAWENQKLDDRARLEAIYLYAEALRNTHADSALHLANEAYDFATERNLTEYQSKAKTTMGEVLQRKGDFEEAEIAYSEAITLARIQGDSAMVATNYRYIGTIYSSKGDYEEALVLYNKSLAMLDPKEHTAQLAGLLNSRGIIYIRRRDYAQATQDLERSMELYRQTDSPEDATGPANNLAILKTRQGDYSSAIDLYTTSLEVDERVGNEYGAAYLHMNLANLYYGQGDNDKFFEHVYKSLEIRERIGDKQGIVRCYTNIGSVLYDEDQYDEAYKALDKGLILAEELGLKFSIAHMLLVKGSIQVDRGEYQSAFADIERAAAIYGEIDDKIEIARSQKVIGYYYKETGDYTKAIAELNKGMDLVRDLEINLTEEIALLLYQCYREVGKTDLALLNYELYISSRDSIASAENKREIIRQEYKYEYDTKALADSISFASQRQIQEAKLEKTNNQRIGLFVILLLVAGFSLLLYNRIRLINKQKATIEVQNEELNSLNENLEQKVEERTREVVEANNSLKESEERYAYAMEASNDGIWDYDVVNDSLQFSPAIYTMLGYQPNEFPPSREGMYRLLHSKELRVKKRQAHDLFIAAEDQDYILDEYRLNGKDGQTIWVMVKGKIVEKDEDGKPLRIVGTHTDITADKLKGQELLDTVLRTKDEERSRISKEIHDGLQQTLTVAYMNFRAASNGADEVEGEAKNKFELGMKYLQDSISESRSVAHALMPKAIADYGILSVFENTITDLDNAQKQTKYYFSHNLKSGKLSDEQIEITLYRILQEAINNITKYAQAKNVHIQLKEYEEIFMLTIEDDGVGFDAKLVRTEGSGLGFRSMQTRLDAIDGYLEVNSQPGKGTQILVEINKELT